MGHIVSTQIWMFHTCLSYGWMGEAWDQYIRIRKYALFKLLIAKHTMPNLKIQNQWHLARQAAESSFPKLTCYRCSTALSVYWPFHSLSIPWCMVGPQLGMVSTLGPAAAQWTNKAKKWASIPKPDAQCLENTMWTSWFQVPCLENW